LAFDSFGVVDFSLTISETRFKILLLAANFTRQLPPKKSPDEVVVVRAFD
jgi:hypothetical protein